VNQAVRVNRGERPAQIQADRARLAGTHRAILREVVFERGARDELGPDAHGAVTQIGTVHDQHVGVPHACKALGLLEQLVARARRDAEELEGHLALK